MQLRGRIEGVVHRRRALAVSLFVLGWTMPAQSKDLALVSNKSNELVAITFPELVKICKGQVNRWPDGKPVSLITRDPTAPEMKLLLEKVYGMSKDEVKTLIASANHGRMNHPAIVVVEVGRGCGEEGWIDSRGGGLGGCVFHQRRSNGGEGRREAAPGARISVARKLEQWLSLHDARQNPNGGFYLQFETC